MFCKVEFGENCRGSYEFDEEVGICDYSGFATEAYANKYGYCFETIR